MKPSRAFPVILLLFATVAGFAVAWREYQELVKLRAEAGGDDRADLRKRLFDAQNRIKSLQDQLAAQRGRGRRNATGQNGSSDTVAGQQGQPDFRRAFGGLFRAATNSPEFQKLAAIQQKAGLDARYAALFKALVQNGMNPEQLDQFKNLLVQKQQAAIDSFQAARDQGLDPRNDPAGFQQVISNAESAVDSQIESAFGNAVYSQYAQYEQTLPQHTTVNQLQLSLSYTATPLTDDQANQLVQILANASSQGASGTAGSALANNLRDMFNPNGPGAMAPITTQAITMAQGILSQPQIQALQQIQQQQQARQQMEQLFRTSLQGGAVTTSHGPGGG